MCSTYVEDFYSQLRELDRSREHWTPVDKPSPLSSVLSGQAFTRDCLNEKSFGIFDFSTRFDADEVEWFLNKPIADAHEGNTCVHEAVLSQRIDNLTSILKLGGSPNVKNFTGKTPVHCACDLVSNTNLSKEILKLLLSHGGDLYQRDNVGVTPLQSITFSLYTTVIQDICSSNVKDMELLEKLHGIIQQQGPLKEFEQLCFQLSQAKSDPEYANLGYQTLLFRACKEGWTDGVYFILSQIEGTPPTNKLTNETPLHAACEGNHYEIVKELVTKFPKLLMVPDHLPYRRWQPIHTACAFGTSDRILEVLLVGTLCLMEKHEMLIAIDTFVNMTFIDALGNTPLYIATKCGNISHVSLMTTPSLFHSLFQIVPTLYVVPFPSVEPWPSPIHCAIAHNREELLITLIDMLPVKVLACPSLFCMRHILQHMHKDAESKPVIYPLLETTICESTDGGLYLTNITTAIQSYTDINTAKEHYKLFINLKMSPVAMAAAMGNAKFVETLLDKEVNDDNGLALRLALHLQYYDIARTIVSFNNSQRCLGSMKKLATFLLPSDMLNSFTEIHLEDNCLKSLPLAFFQLPKLTYLNVSNNNLVELPVDSSNIFQSGWKSNKLKTLRISYNKLKCLPAAIWSMYELKELQANNNCIIEIEPPATKSCAKPKSINVSHNELCNVPQQIFLASEKVNISYNKLECLPDCIWTSKTLSNLNAANNQIKVLYFPVSPCNSKHKPLITPTGERMFPPYKSESIVEPYNCNVLSSLNLSSNNLISFPKCLTCFAHNLQDLNISNNQISVLCIYLLPPCLKCLSAKECSLENIETNCDKELFCPHKSHKSLESLAYLNLKGNKLCHFSFKSDTDTKMRCLIYPNLEELNLSNNMLYDQLDSNVGHQKHLNSLILSNNPNLHSLPLELSCLTTLRVLELDDLPCLTDPHLQEYQSHQSSKELLKLLSYMKSAMKSTVNYRKVNLIIVGAPETGKTLLMKKLIDPKRQNLPKDEITICIRKTTSNRGRIYLRIWDFPNHENHTNAFYCFYSKQAIYLVVFKLTDGTNGIKGLDNHLRNIKAHAPECPVMIIGTHCDAVNVKEDDISKDIYYMYRDNGFFPRIADVCCVSNIEGNMKALRKRICSVAWRLRYQKKNKLTLASETDSKELSNDPSAILKQYIPKSYLSLQNEIYKKASEIKNNNLAPIMDEKAFYEYFYNELALFEDEGEMVSAVEFLHCQSNLFHFEDQSLSSFYFLDLQWIFSTMINIMKITGSNGIVSNDQLIAQSTLTISRHLQAGFLALLAKFNFAISYKSDCLLVHTLLPKHLGYSMQPLIQINTANTKSTANECPSEKFPKPKLVSSQEFDTTDLSFLPLRKIPSLKPKSLAQNLYRTWLASFIPDGFWPQLLTKIISDDSISSILSSILFIPLQNNRCSLSYANTGATSLWKLHQKGFVIEYENKKLLELREVSNKIDNFDKKINLSEKYASQVELVIYTGQIASLCKECQEDGLRHNPIRMASKMLVLIEQHILDIREWFPDTFCDPKNGDVLSYVPCPLGILQEDECISCFDNSADYHFLCFGGFNVICFSLKDILEAYAKQSKYISCPTHEKLSVQQLAPDVCFEDLDNAICNPEIPLIIDTQTELGKGGFAIVLRGKLDKRPEQALVAVKIIHDGLNQAKSLTDFLSNYTASVKGYRLIRREINFLSTLHHDNLTPLCGAHTNPFMLLMKLAPFGSLNTILKQYRDVKMVLDPAVLQASVYQVASAVDFLHQKHVLHCDLKSGNVLVWKFPLPRQQNAGQEVLLKITDYGISRTFSANNKIRYSSISGTPGFIAPEVYTGKYEDLQSNKIDVFAFGMFLYELITLLKPFELLPGSPEALVRKKERPQIPKENFTPCLFQHIMKVCWSHNPDNRPSMAQVVKWSQFPELQFLRIIHELELKRLSGICQCQVVRDHVHQHATVKPQSLQNIIPNCEKIQSLFSSLPSLTPQIKRKKSKSDNHTQIWIAQDKDEITTKLTIVTLRSSDLGYYVYEDTVASKVVAMTNVRHHMWIYTNDQNLYVIQTAKIKTIACVMLKNTIFEVTQLLHVPEWHLVLVLWELSEIWCLYDETNASGLYQMGTWKLSANSPISSLCTVTFESTTEVWATRKDKEIVVLSRSPSGCCESNIIVCCTNRRGAHNCHLITCLQFNTDSGKSLTHVWVSFDGYPQLVCWDGPSKTQLHTISLQSEDEKCQSTSLLGHKHHLYVGTSSGKVEVYNSENGYFLQQFSWHSSKVDDLIELPPEIKQSICAESKTHQGKVHHYSLQSSISDTIEASRKKSVCVLGSYMSKSKSGLYSVPAQSLPLNSPLIVSFGDNLAEHLNIGDQNAQQKKIEFLMWTGCYTN